jgi:hypothetical protein
VNLVNDRPQSFRPDPAEIARALEIDGQYVAEVPPQREHVVALRRAGREAADLLGSPVRVTSTLPDPERAGRVTVVVGVLKLDASDRERLGERARVLADEFGPGDRERRRHNSS